MVLAFSAFFEDAVTCSGASVPETVQTPPRLCTAVGADTDRPEVEGHISAAMAPGQRPKPKKTDTKVYVIYC